MIRSILTLLLVTLIAMLPGCAKYQSEAGGKKKLKIGVSIPAADPGKQIADVEDMLAQHIDGLVILAVESAPLTDVCVKAHERGVYIVKKVMERDPMYPADNTYPPGMIAAGIELAAAHLRDGDLAKAADRIPRHLFVTADQLKPGADGRLHVKIGVRLITPDNAKDFYFPDSVY